MKKILFLLLAIAASSFASDCPLATDCPVQKFNEQELGTLSGRIQMLSMVRDFEGSRTGANTTLGLVLGYISPEFAGFDFGVTYNGAAEFWKSNNSALMLNDDINVLNEAWLRYRITSNTTITVGRKINNGEVFRADDFRQKARSIEAVQLEVNEVEDLKLTLGHAIRMSNWIDAGDRWDFNDFGDVPGFGSGDDTDGITWTEAVYTGFQGLEIALFDAYAYNVANLVGARVEWDVATNRTLVGTIRHENDVGNAAPYSANAFGLSLRQKIGDVTLEPGYFTVRGGNLRFQETTTGINHPLGALMIIYASPFSGGSDTVYLKATTTIGKTKLYGLYHYTWHDKLAYDAQELNVVVKQPICDRLSVCLKAGVGHRDWNGGTDDTTATDTRLFVTYNF